MGNDDATMERAHEQLDRLMDADPSDPLAWMRHTLDVIERHGLIDYVQWVYSSSHNGVYCRVDVCDVIEGTGGEWNAHTTKPGVDIREWHTTIEGVRFTAGQIRKATQ